MKIKLRNIWAILLLGALVTSCVSNKPKGMRKSRKKDCDCPSFGHLDAKKHYSIQNTEFNG